MKEVLICMAVHDLEGSGRTELTRRTVSETLLKQVNQYGHTIVVIDNASCQETKDHINVFASIAKGKVIIIENKENKGTAYAINQGIREHRMKGQHVIKIDNDVIVHYPTSWVDDMVDAIERDPAIGVLGLKRRDLQQFPDHETSFFRSKLVMLPHKPGEKWLIVEQTEDIMGTCTMFNSALLDQVGYLRQPGLYGYDDVDISCRSRVAGFKNAFLCGVDISHIDPGGTKYMDWKQHEASRSGEAFGKLRDGYYNGTEPLYYNPFK